MFALLLYTVSLLGIAALMSKGRQAASEREAADERRALETGRHPDPLVNVEVSAWLVAPITVVVCEGHRPHFPRRHR
jgi:hypothetical protein